MKTSQLIQKVMHLIPYAQINVTSSAWDNEKSLTIQHSIWNEQSYYRLAGENVPLQLVPLLNEHQVYQSIQQILVDYGITENQDLEIVEVDTSDVAFEYKSIADGIARLGLVRLANNRYIEIPKLNDGGAFNLGMIGLDFNTFHFESMALKDEILEFKGSDEDGQEVEIDESNLPDCGLLYLFDYLLTGTY